MSNWTPTESDVVRPAQWRPASVTRRVIAVATVAAAILAVFFLFVSGASAASSTIIVGTLNAGGTTVVGSGGYASSHPGTGTYTIAFTTAFSQAPVVTCSIADNTTASFCEVTSVAADSFTINTRSSSNALANSVVSFQVIASDYVAPTGGGSGCTTLHCLTDVNDSSKSDGKVLKYDAGTSKWIAGTDATGAGGAAGDVNIASIGGVPLTSATLATSDAGTHSALAGTLSMNCGTGCSTTVSNSGNCNTADHTGPCHIVVDTGTLSSVGTVGSVTAPIGLNTDSTDRLDLMWYALWGLIGLVLFALGHHFLKAALPWRGREVTG